MANYKTFVSDTLAMLPAEMKRSFTQMSRPLDLGDNRFPFWPAGRVFFQKTFREVYDSNAWVVDWTRRHAPFQRRFLQDFKRYVHARDTDASLSGSGAASSSPGPATQPPDGDTVLEFGKYRGQTFQEVYSQYADYINFIIGPQFIPKPQFRTFLNMSAFKLWASEQRKEERNERMQRTAKEEEERRIRKAEEEKRRQEKRKRTQKEKGEYMSRLDMLGQQVSVFVEQDPPVSCRNPNVSSQLLRFMYTNGKELALLPGRMDLLPATQWRKQKELFPQLKNLFRNNEPWAIYTYNVPWFAGRTVDDMWVWDFPRIVLYCQVNISLWKCTSSGDIQSITLAYDASRPNIHFLVWKEKTYVLLERDQWLRSSQAQDLKMSLKKMVALDSDQLQNTTQRVLTQLWQYFKRGHFGDRLALTFLDASNTLIEAQEQNGKVTDVRDEAVTIALNATMEKYWQIYVHKRRSANEAALNAVKFRKARLEFIEYVCSEAKNAGVPHEVLYLDDPASYKICADTSMATLAFIGLGTTFVRAEPPFKGSPLILMQVPLEIDPNTGRRAIGVFMQPMHEDIRNAIAPSDSAFHTASLSAQDIDGVGLVPWSNALTLIQANWDGPKNFRQKLFPSISRNDPNWFAYMKGCGLLSRQSFREEWPNKSDALKSTVAQILQYLSAHPPSMITRNIVMSIRAQFERARDEANQMTLQSAEKRRRNQMNE